MKNDIYPNRRELQDAQIDRLLKELNRACWPSGDEGHVGTQIFHDAIEVITHLRNQVRESR